MKIGLIDSGLAVAPIHWALQSHPELWNKHDARTSNPASPHHGLDDIWARYSPAGNLDDGTPHDSVWYPSADVLGIKPLVHHVFSFVSGTRLGGILITRIPAGAKCKPHTDPGWHARYYDKFAVQITSAPGQKFCFEGEELESKPGDLYWFDNSHLHWVENPTDYERITMIICIKREA